MQLSTYYVVRRRWQQLDLPGSRTALKPWTRCPTPANDPRAATVLVSLSPLPLRRLPNSHADLTSMPGFLQLSATVLMQSAVAAAYT